MRRPLILHHLTVFDVDAFELVGIAVAVGCEQISVFTHLPAPPPEVSDPGYQLPSVTRAIKSGLLKALSDNGISVSGVEYFPISEDFDAEAYRPAIGLGRELGAVRAVTVVPDADGARAVDNLGTLCDLADAEGMSVGLEFMPLVAGCQTLERAAWFVDQVGKSNLGIALDSLHLIRSGGGPADVARLDARYFSYAQINDGHSLEPKSEYFDETFERALPGEGRFPLIEIFNALPANVPIEVETPSRARAESGGSAMDHARAGVSHARAILDALEPNR